MKAIEKTALPLAEGRIDHFPCGCDNSMQSLCIDRHHGHVSIAFLDGSVRRIGLKQLWTLQWHRNFNTANFWTRAGGAEPDQWPEWMRHFRDY